MKGYILAAGEGLRMRPLTSNIPKPLLPVAGRPFLEHNIESLKEAGIRDLILLVGWRAQRIREHFGDGKDFGVKIAYVEQKERLGTAHAIGMIKDKIDSSFFCLYGDVVLTKESVKGMVEHHKKVKGSLMALTTVEDPRRYGSVVVDAGIVKDIVEKPDVPESNLVNAGAYILEPEIFEAIAETKKSSRGEYEITDSFKTLIRKSHLFTHLLTGEWIDVARPWDLIDANRILMEGLGADIKGDVSEKATIIGNIQVGKGTKVLPGSYIIGPTIIGENCEIGPNAYIRPSTSIGEHCKIGAAVEIKNSIIMNRTNVPHLSYVGDSVIGERCNLGAGTKVANLRLDEREIQVVVDGKKVGSGRRKLGVIMGDDVKTGINATIDVGTIIGEGTFIGLGAVARGTIAPKSRLL
ncbi:MAG: bifunctional sugar-1-phosphate nucleotidylyltransferase/acetyltransferase [Thermoplasmatota archaeon]|nr:NTP transferase domain-containing protein [Candidatus Thermoplasmatota archaeon]MBU1913962.1 NTP transferase domain-containing protein [Candidatus Thermoplasmatota archaeon]